MKPPAHNRRVYLAQQGLTLVEMMVALTIGMVLSLAVFAMLASSEGAKRATTTVNDIEQAGAYSMHLLDGWLRNAGSGFAQAGEAMLGCRLKADRSGSTILPRSSNLPAPFGSVNTGTARAFHLAPLIIAPGQSAAGISGRASDVLVVMAGAAGKAESPLPFSDFSDGAMLKLRSPAGLAANDLVLIGDKNATGAASPCLIDQIAASFDGLSSEVPLGGTHRASMQGSSALTATSDRGFALNLGSPHGDTSASFLLVGVGDHGTLHSYDLLADSIVALSDSVFELRAIYGIDSDLDGVVDGWASPSQTSGYNPASLTDGSAQATQRLRGIKGVRVGLILRSPVREKEPVAARNLVLFEDTAFSYTRELSQEEQHYRYRVMESTIPLRNAMLMP
jgi:type IV pilus assembly protein PilW